MYINYYIFRYLQQYTIYDALPQTLHMYVVHWVDSPYNKHLFNLSITDSPLCRGRVNISYPTTVFQSGNYRAKYLRVPVSFQQTQEQELRKRELNPTPTTRKIATTTTSSCGNHPATPYHNANLFLLPQRRRVIAREILTSNRGLLSSLNFALAL